MSQQASPSSVRWWTLVLLAGFSFVSYLERANISVAAELMIPALGISKVQMGQIFTSFLIGYAAFQIPGGWLGDKLGARLTLAGSGLLWGATTLLTGLVPTLLGRSFLAVFIALWVIRFLLGLSEATTFPVGNRVVHNWMPLSDRAFGSSIFFLGTCSASAVASPLVSWLMLRLGWQMSFYLTAIPGFAIAAVWYRFSRDTPSAHPAVNPAELAYIQSSGETDAAESDTPFLALLRQRNVYLLILSYVSEGYVLFIFVFWLYIYLVEERGFTMVRGGWIAAVPWLTALLLAPVGGRACDWLGGKYGRLGGAKIVIMLGYGLCGILLFLAARSASAWLSVAALSLSIAFLMAAESPFWASAAYLGGPHVGTLSGVMNTAGVLGGIVSTSLVPVLVQHFGWLAALGSGMIAGLFAVAVWIFIR